MAKHETYYTVTAKWEKNAKGDSVRVPLDEPYTTEHRPPVGQIYTVHGPDGEKAHKNCTLCHRPTTIKDNRNVKV